MFITCYTTP